MERKVEMLNQKMKSNMKKYIIAMLTLSTIGLTACEDVIDVSLDQGQTLLVVEGMITDELKPQKIRLSSTAAYFDNQSTPVVSGAIVELKEYDANGVLLNTDTLKETTPNTGEYFTQNINKGTIGNRYDLRVTAMGETYTSSSTMQRIPPIDSIVFKYETYSIPDLTGWHVFYHGPETEGLGDNYLFRVHRNGKLYNKPWEIYFASDELVDGNYISNVDLTPEVFDTGDTIKIELFTMSRDQYYFYVELSRQVNNGGIFASPPANVRTNIYNVNAQGKKAVGYFSANATNSKTEIIR